jgi:hypothetical protein
VAALADQIDHRPVFFALLNVSNVEFGYFRPTKTATQKHGQNRPITLAYYRLRLWRL